MQRAVASREFRPIGPLRNPHLQSVLGSSGPRRWKARLEAGLWRGATQPCLLDCGRGVRLQGFHTRRAPGTPARGLVVLLHGWEGCADSTYMLSTTARLHREGYEVFRLNFRDHGGTHHLNPGLFHSCRIREAVGAVAAVAQRFPARPLHLAGFSLGGNFALRIALRAPAMAIPLAHAVAVSPVIDPEHGVRALDDSFFYQRYFLNRWRQSLRRKQAAFPGRYDFRPWYRLTTVREATRFLVERHGPFATVDEYLQGYSVAGERLAGLQVPATIITAADDPIIPVADFYDIEAPSCLEMEIVDHGGHCGFVFDFSFTSWVEGRLLSALAG